jgi:hypothetical protein
MGGFMPENGAQGLKPNCSAAIAGQEIGSQALSVPG